VQPARRKKQLVTKIVTVPGNLEKGCNDFNSGRFYESHEHFEEIWQYERGSCRDAYKGLIQIAAAFVHLSRGKYPGAERLLRTALGYLAPYRHDGALGFDMEAICRDTEDVYGRLIIAGRNRVGSLDLRRRPVFAFDAALLRSHALRDEAWGFGEDGGAVPMEITVAE
jgi:hypothetical protein